MAEEEKTEETLIEFDLSEQANQAVEYLEISDPKALKAVNEYFRLLINELKAFDIPGDKTATYDVIFERANQMTPVRDEVIKVITAVAKFEEQTKFYTELHSFFENLLPYFYFRNEGESNSRWAADHYIVFGSELFLYTVAALLKHRKFEQLNELTHQGYYIPSSKNVRTERFILFNEFNRNSDALAEYYRNKQMREDYSKAAFLKERIIENEFSYEDLAQADFILHLISLLDNRKSEQSFYDVWKNQLPTDIRAFELFVRSESLWFFQKFAKCLREVSKENLTTFLEQYKKKIAESGMYYSRLDWEYKIALDKIATRP